MKGNFMPKVTFVVPVYDGDAYLSETLFSMMNQSMKDIEIIVVDDASPDFTPELMAWFLKMDSRIRYHRMEQNGGVCEARNFGNREARSEIICPCDQDDISTPHRAAFSYYYMMKHKDINCLTSSYWELNVDGEKQTQYFPEDMTLEYHQTEGSVWMHSSACYRKEDILRIPYRQVDGATDDWIFLDDWLAAGMKFKTVKHVLANVRRLPWGQMSIRSQMRGMQPSYIL